MQGIRHLDWTERSGRCYREARWRKPCACFAHALPFATDLSLSPSSPFPFHYFLLLQGGSEKKLQFSTRLPRRNARWMRMRGRMELPITWVSTGRLHPLPFLELVEGSREWGPTSAPLTQCRHRTLQLSALLGVRQSPFPRWMQDMNRHSVSPTLGEHQGESNDSVRDLKYNSC